MRGSEQSLAKLQRALVERLSFRVFSLPLLLSANSPEVHPKFTSGGVAKITSEIEGDAEGRDI